MASTVFVRLPSNSYPLYNMPSVALLQPRPSQASRTLRPGGRYAASARAGWGEVQRSAPHPAAYATRPT